MDYKVICPICESIKELEQTAFLSLVALKEVEVVDSPAVDGLLYCAKDQELKFI